MTRSHPTPHSSPPSRKGSPAGDSMNINRQPAGQPTGGQFAAERKPASGLSLKPDDDLDEVYEDLEKRLSRFPSGFCLSRADDGRILIEDSTMEQTRHVELSSYGDTISVKVRSDYPNEHYPAHTHVVDHFVGTNIDTMMELVRRGYDRHIQDREISRINYWTFHEGGGYGDFPAEGYKISIDEGIGGARIDQYENGEPLEPVFIAYDEHGSAVGFQYDDMDRRNILDESEVDILLDDIAEYASATEGDPDAPQLGLLQAELEFAASPYRSSKADCYERYGQRLASRRRVA